MTMRSFTIFLMFLTSTLYGQKNFNLELISNVDIEESVNDVWGFEDKDGIEYAIVGSQTHTYIYSLEFPDNLLEMARIEGTNSTWRDIKSFGNYLYVIADQGSDGLLIIDMTSPKDSIPFSFYIPTYDFNGRDLRKCHNLFIDDNGFAYLAGCRNISDDIQRRGFVILDLNTDPKNPPIVGVDSTNYAHDVVVQRDTLYASEIFAGQLGIYNVADKANADFLASVTTGFEFTHNAWMSDDGKTIFTTDERANASVEAYDISDIDDINLLDQYKPIETTGKGLIPHNTHFINDYLVTSWYNDGVNITDVSEPDNIIKVASFDTFEDVNNGFFGCWGAYPYLPSGLILATDRSNGLFVLNPTYVKAARLKGVVVDFENNNVINGVEVKIQSNDPNLGQTNALGAYKTGQTSEGEFDVLFSHPDYFPETVSVNFEAGLTKVLNVSLQRKAEYQVEFKTVHDIDNNRIPEGRINLVSPSKSYAFILDENGEAEETITEGIYEVFAGAWGYFHENLGTIDINANTAIEARLDIGYQDDFIFDFDWVEEGEAVRGNWLTAEPLPTFLEGDFVNVNEDIPDDYGQRCAMTGNNGNNNSAQDIDRGFTQYVSPQMDLTQIIEPKLSYNLWFFSDEGVNGLNDSIAVFITNGTDTVMLENVKEPLSQWRERSEFLLEDYIAITDSMHLIVFTGDDEDNDFANIVEGGFDAMLIESNVNTGVNDINLEGTVEVFPNPFNSEFYLTYYIEYEKSLELNVYNVMGQLVDQISLPKTSGWVKLGSKYESGLYFANFVIDNKNVKSIKIVKQQ